MILIADSGSTKTDWCVAENGGAVLHVSTQGINPFHQDEGTISGIIEGELMPRLGGISPESVYYYGSGCRRDKEAMMSGLLGRFFPGSTKIEAHGDLLGAARAVCGREEGIACIMGTGSNSCLYDGREIVRNVPPMGYILGDEGSGAVLGRNFFNALFKGHLPEPVLDMYMRESGLTLDTIINKVYREPLANRFLASTSLFISRHTDIPELRRMVVDNFRAHFSRNVAQYGRHDLSVGAVGSVAYYYQDCLREAAAAEGYEMGVVMRSPMAGLITYHAS